MKFLNKKEQVLDTLLTPYGESLLATGQFKPEYYAFFDDNILYESQYGRPDEPARTQNSIEPRIQENTPQIETQVVFSDRNTYRRMSYKIDTVLDVADIGYSGSPLGLDVGTGTVTTGTPGSTAVPPSTTPPDLGIEQSFENISTLANKYALFERDFYGPQYTLGTTGKLTTNAPAWSVSMIRGEIASAASSSSGATRPTLDIPQIDVALTYKIDVIADTTFISDTELAVSFGNGEILDIEPEIMIAQIKELNSEFSNDNFEIEVYEVDTDNVPGAETATVETLKPLKFRRMPSLVQNGILLDESELRAPVGPTTPDHVQYYFDIKVDGQIDSRLICSSIEENKKSGRYVNVDFECGDTRNIALVDIYSTDAASEPCPDLDDPCEDKPGTVY